MGVYKLHKYKSTQFECNIDLNGASLADAHARLIIESDNLALMFHGAIARNGKCKITIPRLRGLAEELSSGEMTLEVIVDDTYFQPWSSPFTLESSKRVTVTEVVEKKKKMNVVVTNNPSDKLIKTIVRELYSNGITMNNIRQKYSTVRRCINEHIKHTDVDIDPKSLISAVVTKLGTLK